MFETNDASSLSKQNVNKLRHNGEDLNSAYCDEQDSRYSTVAI